MSRSRSSRIVRDDFGGVAAQRRCVGFLVLIVLLIFITQTTDTAQFAFLGGRWNLPLGVAILLAAVCGGLITGTVRMFQLRRTAKQNLMALGSPP